MSVLPEIYRAYLDCLNQQDLARLGEYVDEAVVHNGRQLGLAGYRAMIEADFRQIPDLRYQPELVVCEPPLLAARLMFNCTPVGEFLGLPVNGRQISFAENIFYAFEVGRIKTAWSVIDKTAVEAQLR